MSSLSLRAQYALSEKSERNRKIGFWVGLVVIVGVWAITTFLLPPILGLVVLFAIAFANGYYMRRIADYVGFKMFVRAQTTRVQLPAPTVNSDSNMLDDQDKSYSVSLGPKENMERDLKDL